MFYGNSSFHLFKKSCVLQFTTIVAVSRFSLFFIFSIFSSGCCFSFLCFHSFSFLASQPLSDRNALICSVCTRNWWFACCCCWFVPFRFMVSHFPPSPTNVALNVHHTYFPLYLLVHTHIGTHRHTQAHTRRTQNNSNFPKTFWIN